jgi:thioredoxin-dependent peroxiredoxin
MAQERANAFDFWGARTLIGPELKPGDKAPPFRLTGRKGQEVTSEQFAGKPLLISVVPSLDTGVCSIQTRRFNQDAGKLGDAVGFITVSADLPFAQARWCGAQGVENLQVLSDHRDMSFGQAYGTAIKELRWESRAVFVIDGAGVVRYAQYVPVAGREPDYDAALAALAEVKGEGMKG